jgi:hypothetical protein
VETPRLHLPEPPDWLVPPSIPEPYTLVDYVDMSVPWRGTLFLFFNLMDAEPVDQPALDEEAVRRGCLESVRHRVGPRSWEVGLAELTRLGLIHRQVLPHEEGRGPLPVIWCLWRIGGVR